MDVNEIRRIKRKERMFYLQGLKRCIRCQKQDENTLNGDSLCAPCREKQKKASKDYYEKHKERMLKEQKEWRERLKKQGRCVWCAKYKRSGDKHSYCHRCRAKARKRMEGKRDGKE